MWCEIYLGHINHGIANPSRVRSKLSRRPAFVLAPKELVSDTRLKSARLYFGSLLRAALCLNLTIFFGLHFFKNCLRYFCMFFALFWDFENSARAVFTSTQTFRPSHRVSTLSNRWMVKILRCSGLFRGVGPALLWRVHFPYFLCVGLTHVCWLFIFAHQFSY